MRIGRIAGSKSWTTAGLVLALAMGASSPVEAKRDPPTQIVMADAFRTGAAGAKTALDAGDLSTANAQIGSLQPTNAVEKYVAASLKYQYASRRGDPQAIRRALTDMLESGAAPEAQVPYLRYLAGYYSYYLGEQNDAIAQVNYARQLGYTPVETTIILADANIKKKKQSEGLALLEQAVVQQQASGKPVPEAWFDRAIALSYQSGKWADVAKWTQQKLALYPSQGNWRSGLINFQAAPGLDPQAQLDLYRLQSATGAIASERDVQAYAALAAKSGYEAEALSVIEAARANGKLTASETVTSALLKSISVKAKKNIAALPAQVKKAESAKDGTAAATAGDAYFSLGQFPLAVTQYRLALSKGGVDTARVNSRLGIALARSGDLPGSTTALAQATGNWATVANFWTVWVNQQAQRTAALNPSVAPQPAS
ncbi:MAG: hypothetical protein QHC67_03135 [Sphingobium sp.]|uniref:hypothetical protein n=1 Tax=Sphingobium sp. TaxID=1912891 RepID=UPI0029BDAC83|nr:hypothetical protein [Sphingobium sp.]MDX3908791.1 hypothetical protein [Sphingobium sp.]